MTVFTLKIDINFKPFNQVASKLNMPILTSHIQWTLTPYHVLIQLKPLIDHKLDHFNMIVLARDQHRLFDMQHVYGSY
jgi:hypothetical protein